jgi:glucokinase
MAPILALDFGGTKHAAAIADETLSSGQTQWQSYQRQVSPPNANRQIDLEIMQSLIHAVLNGAEPAAIGVSFGGPVDFQTGTVRLSHHVPDWENFPLQDWLEAQFGVPVRVDNDANVAALGEHQFGAGQGCTDLLYVTVSTGVGGGWILNGKPWRGFEGMAGEIGHMVVDPQGPICLCGKRGCVERLASGPYIAEQAKAALQQQPDRGQILRNLVNQDLDQITAAHVSQAAAQADELAQEILYRAAWALGTGLGNVANLINPQRFILGGGVTKAGEFFWQTVRQTARQTALPEIHVEVVPAILGDDAPLWGAIALANTAI